MSHIIAKGSYKKLGSILQCCEMQLKLTVLQRVDAFWILQTGAISGRPLNLRLRPGRGREEKTNYVRLVPDEQTTCYRELPEEHHSASAGKLYIAGEPLLCSWCSDIGQFAYISRKSNKNVVKRV